MRLFFPKYRPADKFHRPEQKVPAAAFFDRLWLKAKSQFATSNVSNLEKNFAQNVISLSDAWQDLSDEALLQQRLDWQFHVKQSGLDIKQAELGFALVRETARRQLRMAHFPTQLMAGFVILTGRVSEMATGEGKTLMASLPAATAAMAGIPTHVVTVNDYLAQRDAEEMKPIYLALGLTVGVVTSDASPEERKQAYQQDIVYCTNSQLVFDYLKDQVVLEQATHPVALHAMTIEQKGLADQLTQRGLHFAVVDEADSVLVDEARTPLILSAKGELNEEEVLSYQHAIEFALALPDDSYQLFAAQKRVELLPAAEEALEVFAEEHKGIWLGRVRRESLIKQALTALYFYERDIDYLVTEEEKVEIIDPSTGRVMPDRSWSHGLHQLIEIKEGVEVRPPNKVMAKISYQKFFRRFCFLGGMSGTLKEVSKEIAWVYDLKTVRIPTYRPSLRQSLGVDVFISAEARWQAVIQHCQQHIQAGRAVLIGTASLKESETLSEKLALLGIEHQLLNAKQDAEEASIVAKAGQAGHLTIATNMAGRGTDIKLEQSVKDAGGLHVVVTDLQEAGRIDRQLIGRCARQGDPGSYEYLLSMEDSMLLSHIHGVSELGWQLLKTLPLDRKIRYRYLKWLQGRLEARHEKQRLALVDADEKQMDAMLFTGKRV